MTRVEQLTQALVRTERERDMLRTILPYVLCDGDNQHTCERARAAMAKLEAFYCRCGEPLRHRGLHHEECPARGLWQ